MIGSVWSASGTSRVSLVASQVIRGNKKPKIEGQTIKWLEEKEERDKGWSTKTSQKGKIY